MKLGKLLSFLPSRLNSKLISNSRDNESTLGDEENAVYTHNGILFSLKTKACPKVDEP